MHLLHQETHIVFVALSSVLVLRGLVRLVYWNGRYKLLEALQDESCLEV